MPRCSSLPTDTAAFAGGRSAPFHPHNMSYRDKPRTLRLSPRSSSPPLRRLALPLLFVLALVCTALVLVRNSRLVARRFGHASRLDHSASSDMAGKCAPSLSRIPSALHRSRHFLPDQLDARSRLRYIRAPQRSSLIGRTVQRACGELEPGLTEWIDLIERQEKECLPLNEHLNLRAVLQSAVKQCGSWYARLWLTLSSRSLACTPTNVGNPDLP